MNNKFGWLFSFWLNTTTTFTCDNVVLKIISAILMIFSALMIIASLARRDKETSKASA
ncbi:hypothetical protein [Priestia megaterium]|uniref:hypothetical protein n=1 Tax=Priestia megaterium TaxID=1404 RepID=UPI00164A01A8|nr:hypothetical protein [Priestia megaterium]